MEPDGSLVGRALQLQFHNIKNWNESTGDMPDKGPQQHHSEWLCNFTGKTAVGDPEALRFFSLDEPPNVQVRLTKEVPKVTTLKMHF